VGRPGERGVRGYAALGPGFVAGARGDQILEKRLLEFLTEK